VIGSVSEKVCLGGCVLFMWFGVEVWFAFLYQRFLFSES
jgi:hypothetical protein